MYRHDNPKGFTLIELLTVLTVGTVLMAILLPALNGARKGARTVVCQSNIRATGLAFLAYCESYDGCLPPAYTYVGAGNLYDQPASPTAGICHWSGLLMAQQFLVEDAVCCPEISDGGLPPQDTSADNLDRGQVSAREGVIDLQADRCAFTVNEALCPRNRFRTGFENAQRPSRVVGASRVRRTAHTILVTEWTDDWRVISGPDVTVSNSHLPVHGFRALGQIVGQDRYDLNMTVADSERPCDSTGTYRKLTEYDLSDDPGSSRRYPPRLDWVGRNHKGTVTDKDRKASSFFYLDGHVELKSVYETIEETGFEWGDKIYSLMGRNTIQ